MMTGFERHTKKTRRAIFLEEMDQVVAWGTLCALIEPYYPKPGNGRRPKEAGADAAHLLCAGSGSTWRTRTVEKAWYDSGDAAPVCRN